MLYARQARSGTEHPGPKFADQAISLQTILQCQKVLRGLVSTPQDTAHPSSLHTHFVQIFLTRVPATNQCFPDHNLPYELSLALISFLQLGPGGDQLTLHRHLKLSRSETIHFWGTQMAFLSCVSSHSWDTITHLNPKLAPHLGCLSQLHYSLTPTPAQH